MAILSAACFGQVAADQPELTLVPVAVVQDEVDGFYALYEPTYIETLTMFDRTYAFVLGRGEKAIQIMDVTNPAFPMPAGTIRDLVGEYINDAVYVMDVLVTPERAYVLVLGSDSTLVEIDVPDPAEPEQSIVERMSELRTGSSCAYYTKVFEKDGRSFVVVAGSVYISGCIELVDFTDPANPTFVSNWSEDMKLYHQTDSPRTIEIVEASGRTYALISGYSGGFLVIADISNPVMPTIVAAPDYRDGYHGFSSDSRVRDIAIVDWSDRTYAVLFTKDSIQTVDVTSPARPMPVASAHDGYGGFTLGYGPVETFQMSGRTYALVATTGDYDDPTNNAIQIVDITNPTLMAPAGIVPYLQVNDIGIVDAGDRVYALISGYQSAEIQRESVQVLEIVTTGTVRPHTMSISDLSVVDQAGHETPASAGSQVQFAADLSSGQPGERPFAFLVQVQDANGMVVDLSWTAGSIGFGESINLAAGFTPPEPGTYTVTAFAWKSLDDPTPLTAPVSLNVTVY